MMPMSNIQVIQGVQRLITRFGTRSWLPLGLTLAGSFVSASVVSTAIGFIMLPQTGASIFPRKGATGEGAVGESGLVGVPEVTSRVPADLIQKIIDRGHPVKAVEVYKGWLEVDTFEDYRRAWAKL